MIDLVYEAAALQDFLEANEWDFYFIGGVAVQVWGQPRMTQDIDLIVFTNLKNESEYIAALLSRYTAKFHDAGQFALTNRVLPMLTKGGIGIDVTLGGLSDMSDALARSSYQPFVGGYRLRICSPDDLIIMKTIAARPRDWLDVESVIIRQSALDWDYITVTLKSLDAYEDTSVRRENLQSLKSRFYQK